MMSRFQNNLTEELAQFPAVNGTRAKPKGKDAKSGFELTALILNRRFNSPTEQHVMAALADYCKEGIAFPSAGALAAKTGYCKRTVQQCLARLERRGLVSTISSRACKTGAVKARRIEHGAVEALPRIPTAVERAQSRRGARGSSQGCT